VRYDHSAVRYDHSVVLTCKDGSVRYFHINGQPAPNSGDIVTLPVDGHPVKARIIETNGGGTSRLETVQAVDCVEADEI
jgi:hypothetical protein